MSYEVFKEKIRALIAKTDPGVLVSFHRDDDKGLHIAKLSNGTTITGNFINPSITVKCGRYHTMMAVI